MNQQLQSIRTNLTQPIILINQQQQDQINQILQSTQITNEKYTDNQICRYINPSINTNQKKSSLRGSFQQSQLSVATDSDQNNFYVKDFSIGSEFNNNKNLQRKGSFDGDQQDQQQLQVNFDDDQEDFFGNRRVIQKNQHDINFKFLLNYHQDKHINLPPLSQQTKNYKQKFIAQKHKKHFPYKQIYQQLQQLKKPSTLQHIQEKFPDFIIPKPVYKLPQTVKTTFYKFDNNDKIKNNGKKSVRVVDIRKDFGKAEKVYYMAGGMDSNLVVIQEIYRNNQGYQYSRKKQYNNQRQKRFPLIIQAFKQLKITNNNNQQPLQIQSIKWSPTLKYLAISNNNKHFKVLQLKQHAQTTQYNSHAFQWLKTPIQTFSLQYPKIKCNITNCIFIQQIPLLKLILVDEQFQIYLVEMKKHIISYKPYITKLPVKFNGFFQLKVKKIYDKKGNSGVVMIVGGEDYVTIAVIQPSFQIILVYDKEKHFPNSKYVGYPNIAILEGSSSYMTNNNRQARQLNEMQILIGWDKHIQILTLSIEQVQPLSYKIHTKLKYTFPDSTILLDNLSQTILYQLTPIQIKFYSINQLLKYNNNQNALSSSMKMKQASQQPSNSNNNSVIIQPKKQPFQIKFAQPISSLKIQYKKFYQGQLLQEDLLQNINFNNNSTEKLKTLRNLQNLISVENQLLFLVFQHHVQEFEVESFPKFIQRTIQSIHDWKVGLEMLGDGINGKITQFNNIDLKTQKKQLRQYTSRYIQFLKTVIPFSISNLENQQTWRQQLYYIFELLIQSQEQQYLLKQILLKIYRISPQLLKIYEPFIEMGKVGYIEVETLDLLYSVIDRNVAKRLIYSIGNKLIDQKVNCNANIQPDQHPHELPHMINNILIRYQMYMQLIYINQYFGDFYTPFVILTSRWEKLFGLKESEYIVGLEAKYEKLGEEERQIVTFQEYLIKKIKEYKQEKMEFCKLLSFLVFDTLKIINLQNFNSYHYSTHQFFYISKLKSKYLLQTLIPLINIKINSILIKNQPKHYFNYILQQLFNGNCLELLYEIDQFQRERNKKINGDNRNLGTERQFQVEHEEEAEKSVFMQIIKHISFHDVLESNSQYEYWLFVIRLMIRKIIHITKQIKIIQGLYYLTLQHQPQTQLLTKIIDLFINQCYPQLNKQFYLQQKQKKLQLFQRLKSTNYMNLIKLLGKQLDKQLQVLESFIENPKFHTIYKKIQLIDYITELVQTPYIDNDYGESHSVVSNKKIKEILKRYIKLFTSIGPEQISHLIITYYKPEIKQFIYYLDSYPKEQLNLLKEILNHYNYVQFLNKQKIKYLQLLAINGQKQKILEEIKQHMFPLDQSIEICKKYEILEPWAFLLVKCGGAGNAALAIDLYFKIIQNQIIQQYKYNRKTEQSFLRLRQNMLEQLMKCINICIQLDLKDNHYQKEWFLVIQNLQKLKRYLYKTCTPQVQQTIRQRIINGYLYPELIRWLLDEVIPANLVDYISSSINQLQLQTTELIITQMVKSFHSQKRILKNSQKQISQQQLRQRKLLYKQINQGFLTYNRCYQCMKKDIQTKIHYTCGHDIHPTCNQDVKQCISCKFEIETLIYKQINSKEKVEKIMYYRNFDARENRTQKQRINQTRQEKMAGWDSVIQKENWEPIQVDMYLNMRNNDNYR